MTIEDWAQLKVWFSEALAAPNHLRPAILARVRAQAPALALELEALLAAHASHSLGTVDLAVRPVAAAELYPRGTPPPTTIGPYRILRELGRGGAGTVYLAERSDDEFHRPVALKLLHFDRAESPATSGLHLERGSLARMQHANIAILLDWGTSAEGIAWLTTEYVEGEPIDAYCRSRQLGERAVLELFTQVTSAVSYAHGRGVVHRDLKPGNIAVSQAGVVKLLDFGIAQPRDTVPDPAGAHRFTPIYASPEQLSGDAATAASDVYSLAVVLGQLLSGSLPPELSRLPPALAAILRHALENDPARRYGTVDLLQADLNRYLSHRPTRGVRTPWPRQAALMLRRYQLAAALAGLALVVGGGRWAWEARPLRAPAVPVRPAPVRPSAALAFGAQPLARSSPPRTLRIVFAAAATVATVAVVTRGLPDLDFTSNDAAACAGRFAPGAACQIRLRFTPTAVGPRFGAVVLRDAAGNVLATRYVDGTGTGAAPPLPHGPAARTLAGLHLARGLSADDAGNAFFIEAGDDQVDEIPAGSADKKIVTRLHIGSGGTVVDGAGNLYITTANGLFQNFNGKAVPLAPSPASAQFDNNLQVDGAGNLYASDLEGGVYLMAAGHRAVAALVPGRLGHRFVALASDLAGDLYLADYNHNAVYTLPVDGTHLVRLTGADRFLSAPHAIALGPAGAIFIGSNITDGHILRCVLTARTDLGVSWLGLLGTQGLAFDSHGDLFAILNNSNVVVYLSHAASNH